MLQISAKYDCSVIINWFSEFLTIDFDSIFYHQLGKSIYFFIFYYHFNETFSKDEQSSLS